VSFGAGLPDSESENVARAYFDELMKVEGPDIDLVVERSAEAIERDGPGKTFSAESLDGLRTQMHMWVGSRILRNVNEGGMPQKVKVSLHVELEP